MRQRIRKQLIFPMLLMVFALFIGGYTAHAEVDSEGNGNRNSGEPPQELPHYVIEEMSIDLMESFPVEVSVSVRGSLANGCVTLEGITSRRDGKTFEVEIETSHNGEQVCTAIAQFFEESVLLDVEGLPAGTYTVKIGDKTSTFRLEIDNTAYVGDESASKGLIDLEALINRVLNSAQWVDDGGQVALPTEAMLEGTSWRFSWGEIDGERFSSFVGIPITFDFDGEQLYGHAGCNRFFASYTLEGDSLTIGSIGATTMACQPDIMTLEKEFLTALESAQSFTHDPDSLTLILPNGALHFNTNMVVEKTLFVAAEQVDCQGVAPRKCYLVKEEPNAEWEYFYDQIAGFEWEAGYEYELRVRVIPVENPPADASSMSYELIEIVSQNPIH